MAGSSDRVVRPAAGRPSIVHQLDPAWDATARSSAKSRAAKQRLSNVKTAAATDGQPCPTLKTHRSPVLAAERLR